MDMSEFWNTVNYWQQLAQAYIEQTGKQQNEQMSGSVGSGPVISIKTDPFAFAILGLLLHIKREGPTSK